MAAVTLVGPGGLLRQVDDVESLNLYFHNWGWPLQSGTYADAVQTITGAAPLPFTAEDKSPGTDTDVAALIADGDSDVAVALRAALVARWAPAEAITANDYRLSPDGAIIKRIASGTTRASWDATEIALWTVVAGGGGASYTDEQVRDVIGTALVAGNGVTVTVNDAGDTITVASPDASTTVEGVVELATTAETTTGTDTGRAVTPAGVKAVADALPAGYTTVSRQVQALADTPIDPAPPTITVQTGGANIGGATSTLTGTLITPVDAANKARYNAFRLESRPWTGATPVWGPRPPHRSDNLEVDSVQGFGNSLWSIDFDLYGDAFEILVIDSTQVRVITDGRYAAAAGTLGAADGNFKYIKVQYATTAYRRIRIETGINAGLSFPGGYIGGIKVKTGQAMYPPSLPNTKRFAIVHDSFGCGGSATLGDLRGYAPWLARILGFTDYVSLCSAGTGFTLGGTGNVAKFGYRIDDLVAAQPQYLFIPGSVNDYANRATTLPAEALAFYQACKAQLPNTKILAAGAVAMVSANGDAITAVLKAQALTAGIDFIDTTGWTTGLPAALIDTDNYHPTVAGHEWIARRFAPYLRDAWKLPA